MWWNAALCLIYIPHTIIIIIIIIIIITYLIHNSKQFFSSVSITQCGYKVLVLWLSDMNIIHSVLYMYLSAGKYVRSQIKGFELKMGQALPDMKTIQFTNITAFVFC